MTQLLALRLARDPVPRAAAIPIPQALAVAALGARAFTIACAPDWAGGLSAIGAPAARRSAGLAEDQQLARRTQRRLKFRKRKTATSS